MLGDLSGVPKIFLITGRTDMRKSFDGLMAVIRDVYELDPYANAVYLFGGRDSRKLKALHFDKLSAHFFFFTCYNRSFLKKYADKTNYLLPVFVQETEKHKDLLLSGYWHVPVLMQ